MWIKQRIAIVVVALLVAATCATALGPVSSAAGKTGVASHTGVMQANGCNPHKSCPAVSTNYNGGSGSTWPCVLEVFGSRADYTLVASALNSCTGNWATSFLSISAYKCGWEVFGGCFPGQWQYQGIMSNGNCPLPPNSNDKWCPLDLAQNATMSGMNAGDLWMAVASVTTTGTDGGTGLATAEQVVQF